MRNRRWLAAPGALIVGVAATACAALPTSGSVQLSTLQGSGGQAQHGVVIVPVAPGPGWSPTDIVNGFLAASASFDGHHAVAREYLTTKFNRTWRPGWAATIIDSPTIRMGRTPRNVNQQSGGRPSALVDLTGSHFAKLQTAGQGQAGSVVVTPGLRDFQFSLVQISGGYRIDAIYHDNMPVEPSLLLLTSTDFARDYLPAKLYFYSLRSASNALVPDPVFIPQTGPGAEVNGLVNALIHRPPSSSWLSHAATTAFPRGTKLLKTQIIGGIKAVMDFGGAALHTDRSQRERMAAQLAWSLIYPPYATGIRSVVLRIGNYSLQPLPGRYDTYVPRGTASPLYYQVSGAGGPAIAALRPGSTAPLLLPLPAGLANQPFTAMAVTTAQQSRAIIAGCLGRNLYLIELTSAIQQAKKLSAANRLATVRKRLPAACSSLSWDDRGTLWVTAQSHTLVLPTAGTVSLAKTTLVRFFIPQYQSTAVTTLRVAPDDVRVALIVGAGPSRRILVGAISKTSSFTFIGQTQQTLRVGSDIANPVDLAWLDPDHLLVLSRSSIGRTQLFEVPLTGGVSTEVPIPRGVISVAASWPSLQPAPHVLIGIAPTPTSPGSIEISKTSLLNPDWRPLAKGTTPVFPG
jgi:hypothetical protein